MRGARTGLTAADELVLDAIGRRLAGIDDELPRLRPWQPDRVAAGQLHVVRGHVRRARSVERDIAWRPSRTRVERLAAALATVVVAVAVAAGARGPDVGRAVVVVAPTPPGPAFSIRPVASVDGVAAATPAAARDLPRVTPSPMPTRPGFSPRPGTGEGTPQPVAVPVDPAGLQAVLGRVGWTCAVLVEVALDPLSPEMIDKLVATSDRTGGFFPDGLGPGWIGVDPLAAARAFKGSPLLLDENGSLWVLRADGRDGAVLQLVQARSSSGAIAWRPADVLWPTACSAIGQDPKQLIVGRRSSDWPSGTIVDLGVVRWLPRATTAAQPS